MMNNLELTNEELYVLERDLDVLRTNLEREQLSVTKFIAENPVHTETSKFLYEHLDNLDRSRSLYKSITLKLESLRRSKDE
jgi:hypothetical protein